PPMPPADDFSRRVWSEALCDAIVRMIDAEGLDRPVLVGHHLMGDYYALRIALDHPEKVRGVIVIAGRVCMPFPSPSNGPGKPARYATLEERKRGVQTFSAPFYRTVTPETWRAGSFQAAKFCRDAERGAALFAAQIAVPIPTQVRYFLEYQTTDLSDELP